MFCFQLLSAHPRGCIMCSFTVPWTRPSLKALRKPEAAFSCDHVLSGHCVSYYFSRDSLISFRTWLSRAVHCELKVTQGVLSFSTLNRISRFLKVHRKDPCSQGGERSREELAEVLRLGGFYCVLFTNSFWTSEIKAMLERLQKESDKH